MATDKGIQRVLFFGDGCTDVARMAEGLLKARDGGRFDVYSAGLEAAPTSGEALHVMNEVGIDLSAQPARGVEAFEGVAFDHVIQLCGDDGAISPEFARDRDVQHWHLPVPGAGEGGDAQRLAAYREVRDALGVRIEAWMEGL